MRAYLLSAPGKIRTCDLRFRNSFSARRGRFPPSCSRGEVLSQWFANSGWRHCARRARPIRQRSDAAYTFGRVLPESARTLAAAPGGGRPVHAGIVCHPGSLCLTAILPPSMMRLSSNIPKVAPARADAPRRILNARLTRRAEFPVARICGCHRTCIARPLTTSNAFSSSIFSGVAHRC